MKSLSSMLSSEEKIVFELRSLYQQFGYTKYKMSKFEEYDLYAGNKDFLVSDHIITFTDTNGKLMALKPDVTLSIVRSSRDSGVLRKVYYNENVYRVSGRSRSFQEIMQSGIECIGPIDDYCVLEVVKLARKSLRLISEEYVLTVSDLDLLSSALDALKVSGEAVKRVIACIGSKNVHELNAVLEESGADPQASAYLKNLASLNGPPAEILEKLSGLGCSEEAMAPLKKLIQSMEAIGEGDGFRVDLSLTGDMNYYNGIIFKGYVKGIPAGVISGGRYDRLMRKMGKKSGAVGFAVYLDMLERYFEDRPDYDVDALLLYQDSDAPEAVTAAAMQLAEGGKSVMVQKSRPKDLRCRVLAKVTEKGVEILEADA